MLDILRNRNSAAGAGLYSKVLYKDTVRLRKWPRFQIEQFANLSIRQFIDKSTNQPIATLKNVLWHIGKKVIEREDNSRDNPFSCANNEE
jgi:hypothetical protein